MSIESHSRKNVDEETDSQLRPRRDVWSTLNYYANPGDGTKPTPVYVNGSVILYLTRHVLS